LKERGIPSMIYYPIPAHKQKIFDDVKSFDLSTTESLTKKVISLPIHTEMTEEELEFISSNFLDIINNSK
jgi:dTDP-4-amino-4,6-dideoxygalactose transaminase